MKRPAALLCSVLVLLFCSGGVPAQPAVRDAHGVAQNLLAAMRLWGDIKFFDPAVSDGKVDWDAAFMNAEPAIVAAATPQAYRAAIASMLAPLNDLATHVDAVAPSSSGRIRAVKAGDATIVTVPRNVGADQAQITAHVSSAVELAAKSDAIAIDLRGVNEAAVGSADVFDAMFSAESPFVGLISGSLTFPRERSRSYLGYPNQDSSSGYQGYSVFDSVRRGLTVAGTSKVKRRFLFLVDAQTSLPPMALALASAGEATIFTAGGSPSILAPSTADMEMPDGVVATYRTGDLADIDRPVSLPIANSPQDAIAKAAPLQDFIDSSRGVESPSPHDNAYADVSFPPAPMRMLAIARIYNVIRYFSPYIGLMHDDWDAAALQGINDEATATDAPSYLLGIMKFYAHLHDSHGFVGSPLLAAEFGAGVPFESRYLHGRAVVTQLAIGHAASAWLRPGTVIEAVDGVPIRQAMNHIEEYLCASTRQAADYAALRPLYYPSVFSGKKDTSISIAVRDARGQRRVLHLTRDRMAFLPERSGPTYLILPGNVGYVDFDRLDPSEVDAMFESLKNTRAIVFDNRGYPRGAAWPVAPRLTAHSNVRAALFDTPLVTSPLDVQLNDSRMLPIHREFYQLLPATTDWRYLKPTVMLVDERSISQSEHSVLFFRAAAGTRIVGTPTDGADGDVTSMVVPGGISLSFSGEGVRYADGKQLQRVGIIPDVRVEPTAAEIAARDDVVLQRGLQEALTLAGSTASSRNAIVRAEVARERRTAAVDPYTAALAARGQGARPLDLPWVAKGLNYTGTTTAGAGYRGSDEMTLTSFGATIGENAFGTFAGSLALDGYRGKTIRIRGFLSAEGARNGVGFWLRIDGPDRQFDNMQGRWLTGTSAWKPFAIVLHVPESATKAFCGLLLVGFGTAHASGLTIDVVPDATPATGA